MPWSECTRYWEVALVIIACFGIDLIYICRHPFMPIRTTCVMRFSLEREPSSTGAKVSPLVWWQQSPVENSPSCRSHKNYITKLHTHSHLSIRVYIALHPPWLYPQFQHSPSVKVERGAFDSIKSRSLSSLSHLATIQVSRTVHPCPASGELNWGQK